MQFRDIRQRAEEDQESASDSDSDLDRFAATAAKAFDAATRLVAGRGTMKPEQFAGAVADLLVAKNVWAGLAGNQNVWQLWPDDPQPFGPYHQCGDSALHTACLFAHSIAKASEIAKVFAFGVVPTDDIESDKFFAWQESFVDEIQNRLLPLENWPMHAIHRDSQLILRKIQSELRQAERTLAAEYARLRKSESESKLGCVYKTVKRKAAAGTLRAFEIPGTNEFFVHRDHLN